MDHRSADELQEEEMPFFKWGKKDVATTDVNYKAKVENKLSLAKQNPEPIFDLTDCNLHEVPSGVYSWCKICRKEVLLLQNNVIKALDGTGNVKDLFLLRVLDVHNNKLTKLPLDIGILVNLQALYLQFNQLKSLPDSLKNLNNLQELNLQGNLFKDFPESVCHLPQLRQLDISANLLNRLPNSFSKIRTLRSLTLDAETYVYPPKDVCAYGLEHIMWFLCRECGVEYSPITSEEPKEVPKYVVNSPEIEDRQKQAHLDAQKSMQLLLENLSQLATKAQTQKDRLLEDLIQDKDKVGEQLLTAQQKKDVERKRFLEELIEVEQESMAAIFDLLQFSENNQNTEVLLLELERDRKEFEELFLSSQREAVVLRRKDVLMAMESILENQFREAQSKYNYSIGNRDMLSKAQQGDLERDLKLGEIMTQACKDKEIQVTNLLKDEQVQKKAFGTLLLRKDEEFTVLSERISLIENELANLTLLEVKKKVLRMGQEKDILEEQRELLTKLLIQLMSQQDDRRKEFAKRLDELEERKSQEQIDYWLLQYQRLMDSKPDNLRALEKCMSEDVKAVLRRAKAKKYVPLFAKYDVSMEQLRRMSSKELQELGVWEESVRQSILTKAQQDVEPITPVAEQTPQMERSIATFSERQASVRARFECECVVCMEKPCNVLFLNCGHVCTCDQCGPSLKDCPLCRSVVARIVALEFNAAVTQE